MKSVKLLRLTNNEDIIANVELVGDEYIVETPMAVLYNKNLIGANPDTSVEIGSDSALMMLSPWVLPSIIRGNTMSIHKNNVMFAADVTDKIYNYYTRITGLMNMIMSGKKLTELFDLDLDLSDPDSTAETTMELAEEPTANSSVTAKKKLGKLLH